MSLMSSLSKGTLEVASDGTIKQNTISPTGEVIQTAPTSEVINTLAKRILSQKLITPNMSYFALEMFPTKYVANGTEDIQYQTKITKAVLGDPYADFTEDDLAKGSEIVVYETLELNNLDISKYDAHIWDKQVADFGVNESKAKAILNLLANAKATAFGKTEQAKVLSVIFDEANMQEIVYTSGLAIDAKEKEISKIFTKYGTEGVSVSATIDSKVVNFDHLSYPAEYYMLINKEFAADYATDFLRNSYNISATNESLSFKKIYIKDFSVLEGIPSGKTLFEVLFVHKDAVENIAHFELSKMLGTLSAYTKMRDFRKNNAFKIHNKLIFALKNTTAPVPPVSEAKGKKV